MLSRDADSLYWLSRYVERAENLARVLDVAYRMASMPLSYNGVNSNEWESALVTAGAMEEFQQVYDEVTPENVIEFLAFSEANPSSIQCCFDTARQNARSVRRSADIRNVGSHQLRVARSAGLEWTQNSRAGPPALSQSREGDLAPLRRLRHAHDAAQRCLLVLAARGLCGAGRQHCARARREVSRALAAGCGSRRRDRLLSMGRDPALGFRARQLPMGLPPEPAAMARGGSADPAAGDAAFTGRLLCSFVEPSRRYRSSLRDHGSVAEARPLGPCAPDEPDHRGYLPARPARVPAGLLATRTTGSGNPSPASICADPCASGSPTTPSTPTASRSAPRSSSCG